MNAFTLPLTIIRQNNYRIHIIKISVEYIIFLRVLALILLSMNNIISSLKDCHRVINIIHLETRSNFIYYD